MWFEFVKRLLKKTFLATEIFCCNYLMSKNFFEEIFN